MTFDQALAHAESCRLFSKQIGAVMDSFPKGPMGLTPDEVRATPEYRKAKLAYAAAFANEREANKYLTTTFKAEYNTYWNERRRATRP